jgi:hypothetical protein
VNTISIQPEFTPTEFRMGAVSFVLSCQLSERIAAIGTVAGAFVYPWRNAFQRQVAVIFHGSA